jgi:hypothetical protein
MAHTDTFSRGALADAVAIDQDAVVFWIRSGLLEPVTRETRKHNRFTMREVRLAVLLKELRHLGLNVEAMRGLVASLRSALEVYETLPRRNLGEVLLAVSDPDGDYLSRLAGTELTEAEATRDLLMRGGTDVSQICRAIDFEDDHGTMAVTKDPSGQWVWVEPPAEGPIRHSSLIILNLGALASGLKARLGGGAGQ